MQVKIINLIPTPSGEIENREYRKALGYNWQNLAERIPGDDRPFKQSDSAVGIYAEVFAEMRAEFGEITITQRDGYSEILEDGGESIQIDRSHLVAIIKGMWAGSAERYIYLGTHAPRKAVPSSVVLVDDGSFDEPEGEPEHGDHGWCRICHSYCWGDCEANGARYYGPRKTSAKPSIAPPSGEPLTTATRYSSRLTIHISERKGEFITQAAKVEDGNVVSQSPWAVMTAKELGRVLRQEYLWDGDDADLVVDQNL